MRQKLLSVTTYASYDVKEKNTWTASESLQLQGESLSFKSFLSLVAYGNDAWIASESLQLQDGSLSLFFNNKTTTVARDIDFCVEVITYYFKNYFGILVSYILLHEEN